VKVQHHPSPTPPPPPPGKQPERHGNHDLHDGVQLGHDASSLGEASGLLGEISREETLELRSLIAREGRQSAILGEHSAPHSALRTAAGGLNVLVAAGATWHGFNLLRSEHKLDKVEGFNHLLIGAGCGLTAAHLMTGHEHLGELGGHFLMAHGVGEIGIGIYRACRGEATLGSLQAAHGACLVAAEMVPGAALPLCLTMAALTGAQIWQHRAHKPEHPKT